MREAVEILAEWLLTTFAVFAVLRWDEARMTREQRARAWPPSSKLSAAVTLSLWCLPVHFYRTRLNLFGWPLFFLWLVTALVIGFALVLLSELAPSAAEFLDAGILLGCALTILYVHFRKRMRR